MKKTRLRYELITENGTYIFKRIRDVNKFIKINKIKFCGLFKLSQHRYKLMYKVLRFYDIKVMNKKEL